jgi:uncharacterized protein YciI
MTKYWILFYDLVEDYLERRPQFREEHLALANAAVERGEMVMAGALANPPDGAVIVFKADDASVVEEFARNDPYVNNGLVTDWKVREWTVVIGNE